METQGMNDLEKITNYILLVSGKISDVSLYYGKTGIVLSLMMYAKSIDSKPIKDFADENFNDIYPGIHDGMPIGIEYGLAGVGYGVTLMKKAGLIDCELNDVLFDIDSRIMETDPRRCKDLSFRKGLAGVVSYINLRRETEGIVTSFDPAYLNEVSIRMNAASDIERQEMSKTLIDDIESPTWNLKEYLSKPISIHQGSSYYLLKEVYDKVLSDK